MQIGFSGLLTLLFAAAKLFGYVSWSWWVVFSPLILAWALFLTVLVITLALALWADR